MKELLASLHDVEPWSFEDDLKVYLNDLKIVTVRQILLKALDDDKSDAETKELCLRVLLRLAVVSKNPETLLILARYQKNLSIELIEEMVPLCKKSEVIEDEQSAIDTNKLYKKLTTLLSANVPVTMDTSATNY